MKDLFDQTVSTASATAARLYDQAVDAHLHAWPGALDALRDAIAHASDFALPHALQALVLAGRGERASALQALARAQAAVAGATATGTLAGGAVHGRDRGPHAGRAGAGDRHADQHPADLLAASTALGAYGLFAFSGRADHDAARLDFTEALAVHHDPPTARGCWRSAAGRASRPASVEPGLAMAQQALALRPHNGGNAHVVVHGLFESDRHADTLAFIESWLTWLPAAMA
jgi:tetratricopeptide (TPR) repeat protein